MDWVDAAVIGQVVGETRQEQARNQLIAAHVAQGHDIETAAAITDAYLAQQYASQPVDPVLWLIQWAVRLFIWFWLIVGPAILVVALLQAVGIMEK